MSERAQALEAVRGFTVHICDDCLHLRGEMCHEPNCRFCRRAMAEVAEYLNVLLIRPVIDGVGVIVDYGQPVEAPAVGVSPQPDTALKEAATWVLNVVSGVGRAGGEPEPDEGQAAFQALADALSTPDAQVCVWREREWDYESGCRGTQISRDERSSGPPDGWKHCPYCGKRLEVGTAPQGGEQ